MSKLLSQYLYNGYYILPGNLTCKIVEKLADGRLKTRRVVCQNKYLGKRDHLGNKIYSAFSSTDEAISRAKNFIDNHIVPWNDKNPRSMQTKK